MVTRHIPIERSRGFTLPTWKASPRSWFILEGVALTLLGVLAFALPLAAGLAAALVFGWLLILGGAVSLVSLVRTRHQANVAWRLVSAVAAVAAGVLALVYPWVGAWTLALLAAAYFFVTGVALAARTGGRRLRAGRVGGLHRAGRRPALRRLPRGHRPDVLRRGAPGVRREPPAGRLGLARSRASGPIK